MSECYFTRENQWYRMHKFQSFPCQFLFQILAVNFLLTHFTGKNLLDTKFVAPKNLWNKISIKISIRIVNVRSEFRVEIGIAMTSLLIPISEHDS